MPNKNTEEAIAELVALLPMFMRTLLEESTVKTAANLSTSEEKTLMYIHKHEGRSMGEYSKKVGLARGSFTAVADSLEQKKLVKRVSGPDDRRKCALVLTEEGKKIAREIDARFKQQIAARLAQLGEKDLNNLKNALEIIAQTMEKLNDQ